MTLREAMRALLLMAVCWGMAAMLVAAGVAIGVLMPTRAYVAASWALTALGAADHRRR